MLLLSRQQHAWRLDILIGVHGDEIVMDNCEESI